MSTDGPASSPTPPSSSPLGAAGALLTRARARLGRLSRATRVLLVTTLLAAGIIAAVLGVRAANEPYGVLYSQLERDDAASLVARLRETHVPYRLESEGTTVMVPQARVHELRLELASAGLPRGGGVGFESFDHLRLGATEFEQRVLYRRALEGELARSIGTLRAVQSARVHLVLPERSVFVSRAEPATASIVVRLRPGMSLGPAEVNGIVHLTAASVPSLAADRVALVTTEGAMLHRPRTPGEDAAAMGGGGDDERASQARAMESTLEGRVRSMLERVVGEGHADVRASVELELARVEHTEDHYDPARTALRSEEQLTERTAAAPGITAAGVPGAESNLPTAGAARPAGAPAAGSGLVRESHTRNFEVDHVTERRLVSAGGVRRVTVAAVVDGARRWENGRWTTVARTHEEMDRLVALVRGAVGATDARHDVVTVECVPFIDESAAAANDGNAPHASATESASRTWRNIRWRRYAPAAGAAALLLLVLAVATVRRRRRRAAAERLALESAAPRALLDGASVTSADVVQTLTPAELDGGDELARLRAEANARAASDPASAALVLRHWLGTAANNADAAPGAGSGANNGARRAASAQPD